MEKGFIIYNGVEYPTISIELNKISECMGTYLVTIADVELWNDIKDGCENDGDIEVSIDNSIYYYCDSGFIASNPSEEEIISEFKEVY
jgi:hypothetical protein